MPLGGGGMGGGGYSGGPTIVPASALLIQSMDADTLIMELMRQDVSTLAPGATAADIIANFDGNPTGNGTITIDLTSLMASSSLDSLSTVYEAFMTDQAAATNEYFNYITTMTSADWAAWHSGPTSDIPNILSNQQQSMAYAFEVFMAESTIATAHRQQQALVLSYFVDRAGSLMNTNPGLSFRGALDAVAHAVAANPGDLITYVTGMPANIETVTVEATRYVYGGSGDPDTFYYTTEDGHSGVGSIAGPPRPNVDMAQLNAEALSVKDAILAHSDHINTEYIALIYKGTDGLLHHTNLVIGGGEHVTGSFQIPVGAIVVGWVHNHPYKANINGAVPSPIKLPTGDPGDWAHVKAYISDPHFDPALVTYIFDDHSQHLYGYGIERMGDSIHLGDFIG